MVEKYAKEGEGDKHQRRTMCLCKLIRPFDVEGNPYGKI